jgi:small subunit ribosomal protein S6
MPKYELMYILASGVSDDQVPAVTEQITKIVSDFGGSDVKETQLGKKKLAYPIKKTRNGFYGLVEFTMDGQKVNALDAKIRTQNSTIIRYILVNMDEHYARLSKDVVAQAKLSHQTPSTETDAMATAAASAPVAKEPAAPVVPEQPAVPLNAEEFDKKIEDALSEEIK